MQEIGIYIHIPFCKSKCFYCNFTSRDCTKNKITEEYIESYFNALAEEIITKAEFLSTSICRSIYIGGGTPSYVDAKYILGVLSLIKSVCNVKQDAEITIEVNPGTLTLEKAQAYKESGINRVSLGLQSLNDNTLKKIGRIHTLENFYDSYNLLKQIGIDNISCDYIFGLPDQTIGSVEKEFNELLKLDLKHISSYDLEVYDGTKLEFLITNGYVDIPSDDDVVDIREHIQNILKEQKFTQYEISNYAKEGYESQHNLGYWHQEMYLGLGASASSYINGVRYTNTPDVDSYIKNIFNNTEEIYKIEEELDLLATMKEYVMLHFRLKEGVSKFLFKLKFKEDLDNLFKTELNKCIENGLVEEKDKCYSLTTKGKELANVVFREFV